MNYIYMNLRYGTFGAMEDKEIVKQYVHRFSYFLICILKGFIWCRFIICTGSKTFNINGINLRDEMTSDLCEQFGVHIMHDYDESFAGEFAS